MSMTIEWGNIRAVFAFFPKCILFCATSCKVPWPLCARNRSPRYPGVSPDAGLHLLGTRTRSRTPPKRAFLGVHFYKYPQFFLGNLFFLRTTITDRPVAPWPCHKPEFSNFGSASPKWHSHAEPQRTQFRNGGSMWGNVPAVEHLHRLVYRRVCRHEYIHVYRHVPRHVHRHMYRHV